MLRDKETGVHADPARVSKIYHRGARYSIDGPHLWRRRPQRTPVLFQAGSSRAAAASAPPTRRPRSPCAQHRSGREVRRPPCAPPPPAAAGRREVLAGMSFVVGGTEDEVRRKAGRVRRAWTSTRSSRTSAADSASTSAACRWTPRSVTSRRRAGRPCSRPSAPRSRRQPDHRDIGAVPQPSRPRGWHPGAHRRRARGWQDAGIDGINIINQTSRGSYTDFIDGVVPELRRRGLAQTEYARRDPPREGLRRRAALLNAAIPPRHSRGASPTFRGGRTRPATRHRPPDEDHRPQLQRTPDLRAEPPRRRRGRRPWSAAAADGLRPRRRFRRRRRGRRQDHHAHRHRVGPVPGTPAHRRGVPRPRRLDAGDEVRHGHRPAQHRRGQRRIRRQASSSTSPTSSSSTRTTTWTRGPPLRLQRSRPASTRPPTTAHRRPAGRSEDRAAGGPGEQRPRAEAAGPRGQARGRRGQPVTQISRRTSLDNPHGCTFVEVDQQSLATTLPDVDAGFLFTRLAGELGLTTEQALLFEEDDEQLPYRVVVSGKPGFKDTEKGEALRSALQSDEVREWFEGYIRGALTTPWDSTPAEDLPKWAGERPPGRPDTHIPIIPTRHPRDRNR